MNMNMSTKINKTIKVVLVGDSGVGKSSLLNSLMNRYDINHTHPTIGAAFAALKYDDPIYETVTLNLWDTAGQEKFQSLLPMYLRDADIIVFVYDTANIETLENINSKWIKTVKKSENEHKTTWMLVGNKVDVALIDSSHSILDITIKENTRTIYDEQGLIITLDKLDQQKRDIILSPQFSSHLLISVKESTNFDAFKTKLLEFSSNQISTSKSSSSNHKSTIKLDKNTKGKGCNCAIM